eukprot:m.213776 g.213776  ORF g.213776 m.213776 type:complete len:65 (+) comp15865_c0_seq5:1892-2086(+)
MLVGLGPAKLCKPCFASDQATIFLYRFNDSFFLSPEHVAGESSSASYSDFIHWFVLPLPAVMLP